LKYEVTYSRTVRPVEFESIRIELSKEFDEEEVPLEAGFFEVRGFVLKKIEEDLAAHVEEEAPKAKLRPKGDKPLFYEMPKLASLPWMKKDKEPSKPGEWGWIFTNVESAEELKAIIAREGAAHVVVEGVKFVCRFSGNTDLETGLPSLISRRPYKNERRR
jgi:hypothetical protein